MLWGRHELLVAMSPASVAEMILNVTFEKTIFQDPPHRFEAGTPDISGAIGLGTALDFIEGLGRDNILEHEEALTGYGVDRLSRIAGLQLVGAGQRRLGILSFDLEGVHPHDLATVLDRHHVAVRAGHRCAQPCSTSWPWRHHPRSLGVYNDESDIDRSPTRSSRKGDVSLMDLRELYQDIILDHGRHPRNFRAIEHPTHTAQGYNPLCGDWVNVFLMLDGERIADVAFQGRGCAISTAAASLMTEVLKGKTVEEARELFAHFVAASPAVRRARWRNRWPRRWSGWNP